jgi:hypothetical protein
VYKYDGALANLKSFINESGLRSVLLIFTGLPWNSRDPFGTPMIVCVDHLVSSQHRHHHRVLSFVPVQHPSPSCQLSYAMLIQPNSASIVRSAAGLSTGFSSSASTHVTQVVGKIDFQDNDDDDVSTHGPEKGMVLINESELGQYDVICGRSKMAFNNVGNRRFRVTISLALERFVGAPSRKDKSVVIRSVTDLLLGNGGRFLQQVNKNESSSSGVIFYELNKKQSRLKVGHALRDMALAASRAELSASRPSTASKVVAAAAPTSVSSNVQCSTELLDTILTEVDHFVDRRQSTESFLNETVFESLVQLVAESNSDASSIHSHVSEFMGDSSISSVTESNVVETETDFVIPSTITTTTLAMAGILSTVEGRDSLDASILSWLVDESTNLLDF